MNLLERYVAEMRDRPFTMIMLALVTVMTTSNTYNTPKKSVTEAHHRSLYEISIGSTILQHEMEIAYQQCTKEQAISEKSMLRFLKPMLPDYSTRIDNRVEELQTLVGRKDAKIAQIQQERTREIQKVNRLFRNGEPPKTGGMEEWTEMF